MTRAGTAIVRSDFDDCFLLEPPDVDSATVLDLVREDVRRRRRRTKAVGFAAVVSLTLLSLGVRLTAAEPGPITAVPATPAPVFPSHTRDVAPALVWKPDLGYLDSRGRSLHERDPSFTSTASRVEAVVAERLDPSHTTPGRDVNLGYGADGAGLTIEESFDWRGTTSDDAWTVDVTLSRLGPDPDSQQGSAIRALRSECLTYSIQSAGCSDLTARGSRVWVTRLDGDAFAVGLVQADGEVASLAMLPPDGHLRSSRSPAADPPLSPSEAVELLKDHDLDVIG